MKSLRRCYSLHLKAAGLAMVLATGLSAEAVIAGPPNEGIAQRVQAHTQGEVTYMCGGVGQLESQYMKQAARDYDLMLTFAAHNGAYLADVNVNITDGRGQSVLQTVCGGPIMLVDLPRSGTYKIHAASGGTELNRTVRATDKGHRGYVFRWPQQSVSEGLRTAPDA